MKNNFDLLKQNNKITTQKQLDDKLAKIWGLKKSSKKEKELWSYKVPLGISPSFLIGETVLYNKTQEFIIDKYKINIYGKLTYFSNNISLCLSNLSWNKLNPITNKVETVGLHPSRSGKIFWEKGYYINEEKYKELYYVTKEYRNKFEKTLNKNLNTVGLKSPVQHEIYKAKISNTMQERYGCTWFLCRGEHYKIIDSVMLEKYGVTNVFLLDEWQKYCYEQKLESEKYITFRKNAAKNKIINETIRENIKKQNKKSTKKGVSKFEQTVITELLQEFNFKKPKFYDIENEQAIVVDSELKKFYKIDFFDEDLNFIVEVNGDYWHCNPSVYKKGYFNTQLNTTAENIWKKDLLRKQRVINITNASYFVIWEKDWNNNKEQVIKNIKFVVDSIKLNKLKTNDVIQG